MSRRSLALAATVLILGGCASLRPDSAATPNHVWVSQVYSGGTQCGGEPYEPPDVADLLSSRGVAVLETAVEPMGVCAACSCAAYAGEHFALISRSGLAEARRLGFEEARPPGASRL